MDNNLKVLILVTVLAAVGSLYYAQTHKSQAMVSDSTETLTCDEGWEKLGKDQVPKDQLPKELQGLNDKDVEMAICVRKVENHGI